MKATRHLLIAIFSSMSVTCAFAQYSFSFTLNGGGSKECSQAASIAQSQIGSIPLSGFRTKSECDQARNLILAIKASAGGCNVYYTCTPCTGTDISNGAGANGSLSNNPVLNQGVEVRNNYEDYEYMREIQDMHDGLAYVVGGNLEYGNTLTEIVRQDIGLSKFSPKLRSMIPNLENEISNVAIVLLELHNQIPLLEQDEFKAEVGFGSLSFTFEELTGCDIDALLKKDEISLEEESIIDAFYEFCYEVIENANKIIASDPKYDFPTLEMAYYAMNVYDDDSAGQYDEFCKRLTDVSIIRNPEERGIAQSIIDYIKEINGADGFAADFYYDDAKDKYILSFRGTEKQLDDWLTDGEYLSTGRSPQHDLAAQLADFISKSGLPIDKLTITGHSLGGGLAHLAGLKTGAVTYGYNPLHINTKAIKHYNLDISNTSNIYEVRENSEMLVRLGEATITTTTSSNAVNSIARSAGAIIDPVKDKTLSSLLKIDNVQIIDCGKGIYNPSGLHHRIGDLVKGIETNYPTETNNFKIRGFMAGLKKHVLNSQLIYELNRDSGLELIEINR